MQLDDLYQEIILDHYKHPRHFANIPDGEAMVDEENPTCGDHIKLNATVNADCVASVKIECQGCAICTASSSMMAEKVTGRPVAEIRDLIARFNDMMRGGAELSDEELGDLVALKGVRNYPLRVKCCTMAWHALGAALDQQKA
ncbi:MAG TPA: SUF system NifU family Fe-S cluster assembly protein [Kiritimatiellia bacterium]|nr:SUF system NifU family Fe-S cluster assembly protein [Kiritimatiellia bacterium]